MRRRGLWARISKKEAHSAMRTDRMRIQVVTCGRNKGCDSRRRWMIALEERFNGEVQPTTQPHSDIRALTSLNTFQKKMTWKVRELGSEMLHGRSARCIVSVFLLGSSIELENSTILPICRIWMPLFRSHHQHEGLKKRDGVVFGNPSKVWHCGITLLLSGGRGSTRAGANVSRNLRGADLGRGAILRFNGTQSTKMAIKGPLWKYRRQLRSPSAVTRVI
jgi:hypothetical protein